MAKRARIKVEVETKANYFATQKRNIQFVPSGCTLLDCALGGGWALGRVVNVVGDKSTAKTALATEALINFVRAYPKGKAAYRDAEFAFDKPYAAAMGLPIDKIDFGNEDSPLLTVEDFHDDLNNFLDSRMKAKEPGVYILDSLDALSDDAEMERNIRKGTYGQDKAKAMSIMFRKLNSKVEQSDCLLFIVSQVRDNIGAMFGEKHKRSGGKALDFYAAQILWLAHIKALKRTVSKVERTYGVSIRAKVKKNKVGLAFRDADFDFIFGYGVDDLGASIDWLYAVDRLDAVLLEKSNAKEYLTKSDSFTQEQFNIEQKRVTEAVKQVWQEIETSFLPTRSKYG